jgi:rRNA-processing protein FCF1
MSKTPPQPLKIIMDSKAIFAPLECKIDIFEELRCLLNCNFDCILLSPVKEELEMLSNKDSAQLRRQANLD